MKTIRHLIILSGLFIASASFASAHYNYPSQTYQNYYGNQQYQNYVVSSYVPQTLNNCYYTASYPPTYYGTCAGTGANYSYGNGNSYGYANSAYSYTYPYSNYQNNYNYVTPTTYSNYTAPSQYTTYGYSNGSWYPGYSSNNISNLFDNSYSNNCYYQNGQQVCY